jgi:hypothetical protein
VNNIALTTPCFVPDAGLIINSGQSQSVLLTGNLYDVFPASDGETCRYVSLVELLTKKWDIPGRIVVTLRTDGLVRVASEQGLEKLRAAWSLMKGGIDPHERTIRIFLATTEEEKEQLRQDSTGDLDRAFDAAALNPTYALQLLSQLCACSRHVRKGRRLLEERLLIIIESADLLLPQGDDIARLSDADRKRISICCDWFSDPAFLDGGDSVVLLTESRSMLNGRVTKLPQILEVNIPAPDEGNRLHFIEWFTASLPAGRRLQLWGTPQELAELTASLSLHALLQLMKGAVYAERPLTPADVVDKVELFIKAELGDDVVEFKKPVHSLDDVVGCRMLRTFLTESFIPRLRKGGKGAIPGAAVCGPNGSGKTYIFEAVAGMLGMAVLVIKNIRSKWFGDTDLKAERLERILMALNRAMIFMDEADVMLGGVGGDVHETERRLTGRIQTMMSDPRLLGKTTWLLMTARIHQLSPDLRRPGRAGSLIIPVLDPEGEDRLEFIRWMVKPVAAEAFTPEQEVKLQEASRGFYAALFSDVRRSLMAETEQRGRRLTFDEILAVMTDTIPPAIGLSREYQTLQALVNCTRRSLLPNPGASEAERNAWSARIATLEAMGVRGTR